MQRVFQRHDDQTGIAQDVGEMADNRDRPASGENSIGVVGQFALQEVIERIAIQQRTGADENESLHAIEHIQMRIQPIDGLLFVLGMLNARGIGAIVVGRSHGGAIRRGNVKTLADRRNGGGCDALGKPFIVDEGDIETRADRTRPQAA